MVDYKRQLVVFITYLFLCGLYCHLLSSKKIARGYLTENKSGGKAEQTEHRGRIPRLRLGEVIKGVYFPVQVLQPIGTFKISRFKMFYLSHTHTGCAVK